MKELSLEAFINPVLIAKLPIGSINFSELKRQFKGEAIKQPNWEYRTAGFLEVRNRSVKAIRCHDESIGPNMSALFVAAFTVHDLPFPQANYTPLIPFDSVLLLERELKSVLCSHEISISEGMDKKIRLRPAGRTLIEDLIAQFESYLNEFEANKNEQLLEDRKESNSEFKKYSFDRETYKSELSRITILELKRKIY